MPRHARPIAGDQPATRFPRVPIRGVLRRGSGADRLRVFGAVRARVLVSKLVRGISRVWSDRASLRALPTIPPPRPRLRPTDRSRSAPRPPDDRQDRRPLRVCQPRPRLDHFGRPRVRECAGFCAARSQNRPGLRQRAGCSDPRGVIPRLAANLDGLRVVAFGLPAISSGITGTRPRSSSGTR